MAGGLVRAWADGAAVVPCNNEGRGKLASHNAEASKLDVVDGGNICTERTNYHPSTTHTCDGK